MKRRKTDIETVNYLDLEDSQNQGRALVFILAGQV